MGSSSIRTLDFLFELVSLCFMVAAGFTIWLTGLPCSGKSTIASLLATELMVSGLPVKVLDGDETRRRLSPDLGYSREDRLKHISRIAYLAESLTAVGAVPIVAAISPYRQSREQARQRIERFVEVYLRCPLEVCIQRDVKGHYQKAIKGEIENFTGISDPYEPPLCPEVILEPHLESPHQGVDHILRTLIDLRYIATNSP